MVLGKARVALHSKMMKCTVQDILERVGKYVNILEEMRLQTRSVSVKSLKNGNTIRAQ